MYTEIIKHYKCLYYMVDSWTSQAANPPQQSGNSVSVTNEVTTEKTTEKTTERTTEKTSHSSIRFA